MHSMSEHKYTAHAINISFAQFCLACPNVSVMEERDLLLVVNTQRLSFLLYNC